MKDEEVADLLDSGEPLVLVEAPAGCGKTFQGAAYAARAALNLTVGRILILTHTHAACAAFAQATQTTRRKVEIRTIDSLIVQIATAYHKSLNLPPDPAAWARRQGPNGYGALATRVASLVQQHPFIAEAMAERFPVIISDEHQDASPDQHAIILTLGYAGSRLRIFGDPMQGIYVNRLAGEEISARWEGLKATSSFGNLDTPHRWKDGTPALGDWCLMARESLKSGQPIDLTGAVPQGLKVLFAENAAMGRGFRLSGPERAPIDKIVRGNRSMLILTPQRDMTEALAAFWNRAIPIWEGHTRPALDDLMGVIDADAGDAVAVSRALVNFMGRVATGFSPSSHGNVLIQEVADGCLRKRRGKPARIQQLGRVILAEPNHRGVAKVLAQIAQFRQENVAGFDAIKIDYPREYREATRLGEFDDPHVGLAEVHRRRTFARPMPAMRAISTIHKAKGLECNNALILPCDNRFSASLYSRCRLYVAISRAKTSLTLVVSRHSPSPLLKLP